VHGHEWDVIGDDRRAFDSAPLPEMKPLPLALISTATASKRGGLCVEHYKLALSLSTTSIALQHDYKITIKC